MNTINFNQDNFALTTNVLGIMQTAYRLIQNISKVVGDKFVISGCEETGGIINAGVVCIDGEIMETNGGDVEESCKVVSTSTTKTVQDGTYTYTTKTLVFGSSGDFDWSEVSNVTTLVDLNSSLEFNVASLKTLITSKNNALASSFQQDVDYLQQQIDNKEDAFTKNTGFNLPKSDSVSSSSSSQLATSAAVKTAYDKGASALSVANETANNVVVDQYATKVHNFTCYGHNSANPYQLPNTSNYYIQNYRAIGQGSYYVRLPAIGGIIQNNSIIHIVYPSKSSWGSEYFRIYPNSGQTLDYGNYWNLDHQRHLICQLRDGKWYTLAKMETNISHG